jgi:hypothetical protein
MSGWVRRVSRLIGQSRIRLPRRSRQRLAKGDRVQIGSSVWRVRGGLLLSSGSWAYLLEEVGAPGDSRSGRRTARLLVPVASETAGGDLWTFVRNGERVGVPEAGVVVFPRG